MSEYSVLRGVDETLRTLLWSAMQPDPLINNVNVLNSETHITFEPVAEVLQDTVPGTRSLSLYLYRVTENPELKNRPREPIDDSRVRLPPLCLNLFYLVTALTGSSENDHRLLGKVMQVFYDNAIVKGAALRAPLRPDHDELRIILHPVSLEDLTKLWTGFMRPYHLSIAYEVKVIAVDSLREEGGERVRRKRLEFVPIAGA
jgi:hypothetical protein